ncbi:MAC/perforin domain-containing protein [Chitinophaga flava]|uniref:MACPF domain-containing protein n=1 Tax=Chitinophaga flava TaxID=2259036 RepID=A0A365XX15_9BACT|nr:MAC/perforin domain-containing protein [Chitinophaga flava]RBL90244.1 hypothetical protein DF182_27655 [Chitinophaga flava]
MIPQYFKKNMPWLLVMACLAFFVTPGCKKEEKPKSNPYERTRPRSAGDGKNDLLGYGYDVTGEYAHSSASKFSVLNITAFQKDNPTRMEWDLSKKQIGKLVSGENAVSYLDKLKVNLDGTFGFGIFKGSIKAAYSDSNAFSSKYVYSSFDLLIQQKRGKISGGLTLLKQYLQPSFVWDIENESPEWIVSAYGTHVLTDITLGAKLSVMYRSETTNSARERASEIGVDVSVNKVFSVSVGLNYTYTKKETEANFSQALHYETIGGDPSKSVIGDIPAGSTAPAVDISAWQASSSVNNSELIDFNKEGMIPIYEFIDNPVKKQAVIDYLRNYLQNNAAFLLRTYVKITAENPVFKKDQWGEGTFYDYYVNFYKEDKVTPATVRDITVPYVRASKDMKTGIISYSSNPPSTIRIVDANRMYIGRDYGSYKAYVNGQPETTSWYEARPGQGYEILP